MGTGRSGRERMKEGSIGRFKIFYLDSLDYGTLGNSYLCWFLV